MGSEKYYVQVIFIFHISNFADFFLPLHAANRQKGVLGHTNAKRIRKMANFIARLFGKSADKDKVGGMEDYMTLVRVYFQASLAANLGITNLAMLPDLRTFKATLHVPTVNNRLGLGERNQCKKMLKELYNANDNFFAEIDRSIRKNCRKLQDVQVYMVQFQNFTQDLMMLLGNLMKFKLRLPGFFKKVLYSMTEKTVSDIFNKNDYTDAGVVKTVMAIRQYDKRLGFSQGWVTDFAYQILMLAKKEPRRADGDK